jgi:hypothetical protein
MARALRDAAGDRRRQWQARVRRFEGSGLSVAQFCEAESVSAWSLYAWRRKLGAGGRVRQRVDADEGGFVEVGAVRAPRLEERVAASSVEVPVGMQLRIDLGGGVVLQILRR